MKDSELISAEPHEVKAAAQTMEVPDWVILLAKEQTGSNVRRIIYDWITANKGKSFSF